jgi:hypothetical protein
VRRSFRKAAGGAAKEFMMIRRPGCNTRKGTEPPEGVQAVMAGLVPAIRDVTLQSPDGGRRSPARFETSEYCQTMRQPESPSIPGTAWMAGTSPATTSRA